MHYIDIGSGFPLLLGHSYLFNSSMWSLQLPKLAKSYRVIIPDLWGHGASPELPEGYSSLSDIAHDHLSLMDNLGIKEFGILGLSVGGMWGAELAAFYPKRVKLLALMDTFLGEENEADRQCYFSLLNGVNSIGNIGSPILEYIAKQFYSDNVSDALLLPLIEHLKSIPSERLRRSIVPLGMFIFGRQDKLSLLEKIHVPAIVITGEYDKPRPLAEGKLMSKLLRCEHVIIPGAGHISNQEQPEIVTEVLLRFLSKALK
ncbi:2-succinyl-6-hydroxy-2,4-cyclohexadiene-1-carboxylate synthase [Serratia sp. S1B]|nr:2-succinyl-6-hydroxy-2,4-cyclohexadiene-1-carboxylate synthase [Serratia sp. S1B]